jgi:uncharacterized membrane-anchored protein
MTGHDAVGRTAGVIVIVLTLVLVVLVWWMSRH